MQRITICCFFFITALLTSGEVFQFVAFCQRYPSVLFHILTFSLASAIGQVGSSCYFYTALLRQSLLHSSIFLCSHSKLLSASGEKRCVTIKITAAIERNVKPSHKRKWMVNIEKSSREELGPFHPLPLIYPGPTPSGTICACANSPSFITTLL